MNLQGSGGATFLPLPPTHQLFYMQSSVAHTNSQSKTVQEIAEPFSASNLKLHANIQDSKRIFLEANSNYMQTNKQYNVKQRNFTVLNLLSVDAS